MEPKVLQIQQTILTSGPDILLLYFYVKKHKQILKNPTTLLLGYQVQNWTEIQTRLGSFFWGEETLELKVQTLGTKGSW